MYCFHKRSQVWVTDDLPEDEYHKKSFTEPASSLPSQEAKQQKKRKEKEQVEEGKKKMIMVSKI